MSDELSEQTSEPTGPAQSVLAENAAGPKKVQGDAGSVEQHSLRDQIAAERFLQSQKAVERKGFPIRFHKIKPGGTT
jgi:hypothetical protein